jgi:hypothetical protein
MAAHKPNLNVMTWSADSISPKKHEFFYFLLSNDIDIALINETFLKQAIPFSHPDFRCYRLDREGARTKGGVAIMVRQSLPHSLLSPFRTKVLECIGISVSSPTGEIHFRLIAPAAVVMPKTSAISKATFSSLRPHAQAFTFVAI